MLSCGKTSDFLMCPECGQYHDGYPMGYTRPWDKTCTNCGHKGLGEGSVAQMLLRLNKNIAPIPRMPK